MNAAFALAYLCESEKGTQKVTDFKECIDLVSSRGWFVSTGRVAGLFFMSYLNDCISVIK